eukprot:5398083-Pyramimonas_sp.AAC.1
MRGDQAKGFVYSIDRPLPEGLEWGTLAKQLINSLRAPLASPALFPALYFVSGLPARPQPRATPQRSQSPRQEGVEPQR